MQVVQASEHLAFWSQCLYYTPYCEFSSCCQKDLKWPGRLCWYSYTHKEHSTVISNRDFIPFAFFAWYCQLFWLGQMRIYFQIRNFVYTFDLHSRFMLRAYIWMSLNVTKQKELYFEVSQWTHLRLILFLLNSQ